ncbi:cytochrome P450 [Rhodobacterales bacterium HKCCE2091]|nr:cytochrome P450 [Rhodobacterales bacterium HKCCE2091]
MNHETIADPRTIAEALRDGNLAQALYDEGAVIMEDVLLTLHGDAHRKRRLLEFGVFRRNFFKHYETEIFVPTLEQSIAGDLAAGRAELVDLSYRVTMNLTADFAGIDRPEGTREETLNLLHLVETFSQGATLIHSTRDKDEVRGEVRAALERFDPLFLAPSVARRRALLAEVEAGIRPEEDLPRDVLTVILRSGDPEEFTPDMLRREVAFYLQAGAHSTANSTVHAFHDLTEWGRAHPVDKARMRSDPIFLQRCVHESLRLHPASPVSMRKAICPHALANGHRMEEGDLVSLDLYRANRDPAIFGADADSFNPHRTIPVGQNPFGFTFGIGTHSCLGRDLDGGVVPKADADPETHQYGIVTRLVRRLMSEGARPDPDDPATEAAHTARPNWGRYPVIFDPAEAWT